MKMPEYAKNAVYAKVHCLYAGRLTQQNYNELLSLHSVSEVAEYLKSKTVYSEIFDGISTSADISRNQLENLLYNKMYNELSSVVRFQKAAGDNLGEYYIMKFDTLQLINILSSLKTKSDNYFFTFPAFYNEHSKLDLYALAQASSEDEILELTKKTVYGKTLRDAISNYKATENLGAVTAEFSEFLSNHFLILTGNKKKKPDKKNELIDLYITLNDIRLMKTLFRMVRFSLPSIIPGMIKNPVLSDFKTQQIADMLHAENTEVFIDIVKRTKYRDVISDIDNKDFNFCADDYLYKHFSKIVRQSVNPDAVMAAFQYLSENEIKNIIHIIEGIRYGLSPGEIMPMLCGVSDGKQGR